MLSLTRLRKQTIEKFSNFDRALFKIILVTFGLFLAKIFPQLLQRHRGYYLATIFIVELYFIKKMFGKK